MTGKMKILPFYTNDVDMEKIGKLYCDTFLESEFSSTKVKAVIANINKHSKYPGFKGYKAVDDSNNIVGFTYGYTSLPEQFYNQKIVNQLNENEVEEWLDNCFEFTELAVSLRHRQSGIASKLHDRLLKDLHHDTAILTTGHKNHPAIQLYKKKDWEIIKSEAPVISSENLQVIMGKVLRRTS